MYLLHLLTGTNPDVSPLQMLNGNMSGCDVSSDTDGSEVDTGDSTDTDTGDSTDTDTGDSTKVSIPDGIIDTFSVVGDDEKKVC